MTSRVSGAKRWSFSPALARLDNFADLFRPGFHTVDTGTGYVLTASGSEQPEKLIAGPADQWRRRSPARQDHSGFTSVKFAHDTALPAGSGSMSARQRPAAGNSVPHCSLLSFGKLVCRYTWASRHGSLSRARRIRFCLAAYNCREAFTPFPLSDLLPSTEMFAQRRRLYPRQRMRAPWDRRRSTAAEGAGQCDRRTLTKGETDQEAKEAA